MVELRAPLKGLGVYRAQRLGHGLMALNFGAAVDAYPKGLKCAGLLEVLLV